MSNEINGTGNDQEWVALTANDPAKLAANPDLVGIKASVMSEALKVAPISKRSWLAPVAVAASVALFIGGGAGYTVASSANNSVSIPVGGLEMGRGMGASDSKMASSEIWGGRPFLEAGSGISNSAGNQIGYTFDASDVDRKAQLEVIADVFKIDGEISGSKKDGYFVGDSNYVNAVANTSGSSWDLSQIVSWNFSDSSLNPQYCGGGIAMYDNKSGMPGEEPALSDPNGNLETTEPAPVETFEPMPTVVPEPMPTEVPEPMPTETSTEPLPEPMPTMADCEAPLGNLPNDESAIALAKTKFAELGFDTNTANWSVSDSGQMWGYDSKAASAYKLVTARVVVDGLETNQSWTITIGPDEQVLSASGFYATFVPTAEYEIVGAKTAIERSQDGRWMNLSPQEVPRDNMVYPMPIGVDQNVDSKVKRNSDGQPILDGGLDRITINSTEKSLITWYLNDGSMILLPAYLLSESSSDDSRQWLQLSIADKYVDFS
jgi:hypothetical protein